jgi:hypothetical protein
VSLFPAALMVVVLSLRCFSALATVIHKITKKT